jgi:hypothetical protein
VRADSTISEGRSSVAAAAGAAVGAYSARTTWAFEPPPPKLDTPAILGSLRCVPSISVVGRSQGSTRCWTWSGVREKSMCGLRVPECRLGTSSACFICSSTFVTPAMPAALSAWPMFDFTDPIAQRCGRPPALRKAPSSPAISIGSPREVPVPCASR